MTPPILRPLALLALLGAGVAALASTGCGDAKETPVSSVLLDRREVTVAPGVHHLGRTFPNAAYAIETKDGIALVDTCAEADAEVILSQLRELHLDVRRVRWILLTHAHADHTGGANRIRELSGAKVYAGAADAGVIREGGPRTAVCSVFMTGLDVHPTGVDVELEGDELLMLGGTEVRVVSAPGHSPGSTCYLFERDGVRILFTGDVILSLTDSPPLGGAGTYTAYLPPPYCGDAAAYVGSLRKLLTLPSPHLVLPGHPAADPTPQDPRMTDERWNALVTAGLRRAEALVSRYGKDGADFLDGTPRDLLPGLRYLGNLGPTAVCGATARDGRRWLIDAPAGPVGSDLAAFVAERWPADGASPGTVDGVLLTSCRGDAIAGLPSLVAAGGCTVFAPDAGVAAVRARVPEGTEVRPSSEFEAEFGSHAEIVPLEGLDVPSAAYLLGIDGKRVLCTGREPTRLVLDSGVEVGRTFRWEGVDRAAWDRSLEALGLLRPDLWLPSIPVDGQNANVYDDDWARVIAASRAEAARR